MSKSSGTTKKSKGQRTKLLPASIGHPKALELNEAIVIFNETGNYLSLWNVLRISIESRCALPDDVGELFAGMAKRLIGLSANDIPKAREHVADIVLGTNTVEGGPSVFQEYARVLRDRRRLAVIEELVIEHIVAKPQASLVRQLLQADPLLEEPEPAWTLTRVYAEAEKILARKGDPVDKDVLKRLHEQAEKDAGVFKTNALVEANKTKGVVEIRAVGKSAGRKRTK